MPKLSKKEKEVRCQERQERRGFQERERKRKFHHLKNTGQMGRYYAQKEKIKRDKALREYKPKVIKPEKLTLWQRIKSFFSVIRKILRR